MKHPVVIAILNFLFLGPGYLILGKKKTFGTLALIGGIAGWVWAFTTTIPADDPPIAIIAAILTVFVSFAFAYDGYNLAKESQEEQR